MITITAKIIISDGDSTALTANSAQHLGNNISSQFGAIINQKREVSNAFLLGVDKLDGSKTFCEEVNYFIGNSLCDSAGDFDTPYVFTIVNTKPEEVNFTYFTIQFDEKNGAHPNTIYIDGQEYAVTESLFVATGLNGSERHEISIGNWNKENSPLIITGFYIGLQIVLDKRNIIDITSSIFDRSDLKLPSYGIISNIGNITFNDTDGTIENYANNLMLESGQACEIRLNNTLVKNATQVIAKMETDHWDYDNDSKVVSVNLKDDLEEWQDIHVDAVSYDPQKTQSKYYAWVYIHLWNITSANFRMLSFYELDEQTQNALQSCYMKYPLLESGSLWEQWTKLCEACMLHIYKNKDGVIVCRYNGGN